MGAKSTVNSVMLVGNLGQNPELRQTSGGSSICNFTLATSEEWSDSIGNKQERTDWHKIVFFGKSGEVIAQYAKKGDKLMVSGRLQYDKYTDKEGVERVKTSILGREFTFLASANHQQQNQQQPQQQAAQPQQQKAYNF